MMSTESQNIEFKGTRPLHASQAGQDLGWCTCALSESGGLG